MHSPAELDSCGIGFVADTWGRPSRQVVDAALGGLAAVTHRGALAADARTADGSGVMLPIPAALFGSDTGVASLFVRGPDPRRPLEQAAASEGITVEGWRVPDTDDAQLGDQARASRPRLLQAVLGNPPGGAGSGRAERAAYRLRRRMTIEGVLPGTYVASCSYRTVVYKGLVAANLLAAFYADLGDPSVEAPFVIFHQRFSTNTAPSWERAQPFRTLCHNGEINTIAGNVARMAGRHRLGTEAAGLGPEELFRPLLHPADSDSGMLDSAVELLIRAGRDPRHAVAMLVPPAWEGDGDLDPEVRGFFRFHSALCEPWDGPAGVIFTDGAGVGAALDRNGLRPLRYAVCDDGLVVCCSEAGAVDVSGHGKVRRGRLGPGQMMFVDPTRGVLDDAHCKQRLAAAGSYAKWSADGFARVDGAGPAAYVDDDPDDLAARQAAHGYTVEELRMVLGPMAADAKEPTFAMGDDTPAPPLATTPRPVSHYLKQRFAQVTNPPIDHLRERLVMTLRTLLGPRHPLLDETPAAARLVELETFLLFPSTVSHLTADGRSPFPWARLEAGFDAGAGPAELGRAVAALAAEASAAVAGGAGLVVVDNRHFSADRAPIPSWLAVGAIHGRLVADRRRDQTSLVAVADDVRDVHGTAALLGCGADAICPELALATVAAIADASDDSDVTSPEAQERLVAALEDGVLKVMSKMGIATVDSYRGAMIFEAVGLGADVVETCFPGLVSTVGGVGWAELGADALERHRAATIAEGAGQKVSLTNPGFYRDLKRGGEYHAHNKAVVDALHAHVLQRALRNGDAGLYRAFADLVDGRPPTELHDLLELVPVGPAVDLEEVEPAAAIVERFSTGAMSHGSLSAEAHETLAQAMNLIGGRSNCGEGGEDPSRFRTRGATGRDKNSKIKQVASGRFGVTPEYCAHADELQIKIAQGSKPGEGGQLPGHKV
ncbi:MAG TPA: glutamate synthase central domain-containing protein, partial [Acidimicrobiales bacterium]|nr:glutamate synthase central domain-containing protein [Acidimicrobiales bacterium]